MSARTWAAIFFGQMNVLRRRIALASTFRRMRDDCDAAARSYADGARQAAELASQAARAWAGAAAAEGQADDFERAVSGLLSELDERDDREVAA